MIEPARVGMVLIAAALLTCCSSTTTGPAPIYQEGEEGFLLVGAERKWAGVGKGDSPLLSVRYTKIGVPALYRPSVAFQFTDVMVEKLPVGEYSIHSAYFGGKPMRLPQLGFRILPGQITYVGDFNITLKPALPIIGDFENKRTLQVVDNMNSTVAKFKAKYPEMAKTHTVRADVTPVNLQDEY
jgi:hypothetical protein